MCRMRGGMRAAGGLRGREPAESPQQRPLPSLCWWRGALGAGNGLVTGGAGFYQQRFAQILVRAGGTVALSQINGLVWLQHSRGRRQEDGVTCSCSPGTKRHFQQWEPSGAGWVWGRGTVDAVCVWFGAPAWQVGVYCSVQFLAAGVSQF